MFGPRQHGMELVLDRREQLAGLSLGFSRTSFVVEQRLDAGPQPVLAANLLHRCPACPRTGYASADGCVG